MKLELKNRRSRNEKLLVFSFIDEEDKNIYFSNIRTIIKISGYEDEYFQRIISSLESKIDDMYATPEYKLSGSIFQDEITPYIQGLTNCMFSAIQKLLHEQNENLEQYRDLLHKYNHVIDQITSQYSEIMQVLNS